MKYILILFSALVLMKCATPYQSQGFRGGFSETQLAENTFQVVFKGNAHTSREKAANYCLLRCAEIASNYGFKYFIIVNSENYSKEGSYTTPSNSETQARFDTRGNTTYAKARTETTGGQTYHYSKPSTVNTIICFKEKPEIDGIIYEAEFIMNSLTK